MRCIQPFLALFFLFLLPVQAFGATSSGLEVRVAVLSADFDSLDLRVEEYLDDGSHSPSALRQDFDDLDIEREAIQEEREQLSGCDCEVLDHGIEELNSQAESLSRKVGDLDEQQ